MKRLQSITLDGLVYCKDLFKCLLQLSEPKYTLLFWTLVSSTQQKKWKSSLTETKWSFSSGSSATGQSNHTETHFRHMFPAGCGPALSWIAGVSPVCFDRDFSVFGDTFLFHFTQFHFVFWTHVNVWSMQYPWPHNTGSISLCSEPDIH